jgi:hypothetical protein
MNREVVVVTAMVLDYYAALDRLIFGQHQSQGNLSPNTHTSALKYSKYVLVFACRQ